MTTDLPADTLPTVTREVEEFTAAAGWDQPPALFALVPTSHLLQAQPDLADQVDASTALTPVAQDALPDGDLGAALAGIMWPEAVLGCALVQEIVMLPPDADLPPADDDALGRLAAQHPQAREARLVAAALRDGSVACVLRFRDDEAADEIVEHPNLAPNLTEALLDTLRS